MIPYIDRPVSLAGWLLIAAIVAVSAVLGVIISRHGD